jgi:hypothetical protein
MSDTSESNKSSTKKVPTKNVSYSTDYLVDYLQDSQKLKPIDERMFFVKKSASDNNSIASHNSNNDSINNYVTEASKQTSDIGTKKFTDNALYGSGSNNMNIPDKNVNIFATLSKSNNKPIIEEYINDKKDTNDVKNDNDKKDESEEYDNYNELAPDAQMLKKLDMLRKLGELAQYGVKLSQNYNMNSD